MNLTDEQKEFAKLTMQLDLKAREYHNLCEEFEELKSKILDPNAKEFVELKNKFVKNQYELVKINKELNKLNKKK